METARAFAAAGLERAEAVAHTIDGDSFSPIQPGLFDRRAHFAHAALQAAKDDASAAQCDRLAALRLSADLVVKTPRLRLVLVPHK